MANIPQYSFLDVKPTSLSNHTSLGARRELSSSELDEVVHFIKDIRQKLRVGSPDQLRRRFHTLDAQTYLEEIEFIARNALGAEPLPAHSAYIPASLVTDDTNIDAPVRMTAINGRDWEKAIQNFLEQINTLMVSTVPDDIEITQLLAIAVSQFQSLLHNVTDGNGRLSRMLTIIYWPEEPTPEMIARVLIGSTNPFNATKSFTDPNISVENTAEVHALDLIDTNGQEHYYVPTSWNSIFPNDSLLAALITRQTMMINPDSRFSFFAQILERYFKIGSKFEVIETLKPSFSDEELLALKRASDAVEVYDALKISTISSYNA